MPITKATASSIAPAAKGDLVVGSATNDAAILGVGSNDQVLTADSSTATGLKWAAAGGGGANWSLLNAGGTALTGASTITVSGISGKDKLSVLIVSATTGTGSANIGLRLNTDSGANYFHNGFRNEMASTYNVNAYAAQSDTAGDHIPCITTGGLGVIGNAVVNFSGCNASGVKQWTVFGSGSQTAGLRQHFRGGFYNGSSTISSVSVFADYNFNGGTIYVYTSA